MEKPVTEDGRNKNLCSRACTKSRIPVEKNSKKSPEKTTLKKNPKATSVQSNNLKSSTGSQSRSVTASTSAVLPNSQINKKQAVKKSEIVAIPTSKSIPVDMKFKDESSLELVLMGSPPVISNAHSGITFKPTKRSNSPLQNIFKTTIDGSASTPPSSSQRSPNGTNSVQDPRQVMKEGIKNTPQKPSTGASSSIPFKKCDLKSKENETSSKIQRSKTAHPIKDLTSKAQDDDTILKTELFLEKELQKVSIGSRVGVSAHSGLVFMPKKSSFPVVNIFESNNEGSTRVKPSTSSRPLPRPSLRPQAVKPKTLIVASDESKDATEKTHSGANSAVPSKRTVPKKIEKGNSSKLLRSKTDIAIKPNRAPSKQIQRVQSLSRPRPETIAAQIAQKPAHEAILDIGQTVKKDLKVTFPKIISAHSGIPFKAKKPSKYVNIFAAKTDDTSKPSKK